MRGAVCGGLLFAAICCGPAAVKKTEPALKIYALKYGESLYPAGLVNSDAPGKYVPLNWLAYLVETPSGKTLVDCGFSDAKLLKRFGIQKFKPVTRILKDLGISADKIDTIIITHTHFDHALDVDKFPNARIVLHAKEYAAPEEAALVNVLPKLKVETVSAPAVFGELSVEPVMGHTKGSLIVWLRARNTVFTGDECYFAAACRKKIPLPAGAVFSADTNRRFIENLSPQAVILTGHETALQNGRWLNGHVFLFL
ncbi:MAG: MBL fold metallo-hydrolase [Turneriella sp.]|nr:MBL fold metallo-hydrolase [Turneriella sp.]